VWYAAPTQQQHLFAPALDVSLQTVVIAAVYLGFICTQPGADCGAVVAQQHTAICASSPSPCTYAAERGFIFSVGMLAAVAFCLLVGTVPSTLWFALPACYCVVFCLGFE
jgi:hypothetical protein